MTITNYRAIYRDKNGSILYREAYSECGRRVKGSLEIDVLRYFYVSFHKHNIKNDVVVCCEIVYDVISDDGEYWDTRSFANLYI